MPSVFPQLESGPEVWGTRISGHALSRNLDKLDKVCSKARVSKLYSFYSMTREQYIADIMDGDPDDPSTFDEDELNASHSEVWFPPEDGLATNTCMLEYVLAHKGKFKNVDELLTDLQDFTDVLAEARANGTRWHLNHDV